MSLSPFCKILSTPPKKILSSSSVHLTPLKTFLHSSKSSLFSNNLNPFPHSVSLSSGGIFSLSLNLSKCIFRILSIPEGSEGNIEAGLFQTLCWVSQKHLLHSNIRFKEEGESL